MKPFEKVQLMCLESLFFKPKKKTQPKSKPVEIPEATMKQFASEAIAEYRKMLNKLPAKDKKYVQFKSGTRSSDYASSENVYELAEVLNIDFWNSRIPENSTEDPDMDKLFSEMIHAFAMNEIAGKIHDMSTEKNVPIVCEWVTTSRSYVLIIRPKRQ